jgi:uncharacterized membrane protein
MKAWLKGGLWGVGIFIILGLIAILLNSPIINRLIWSIFAPLNMPISYLLSSLTNCSGEECWIYVYISVLLAGIIESFIIGALIGGIVGKIRNRNKNKIK